MGRAQLAQSLETIVSQVESISGQFNVWNNKREEQKRYYNDKFSDEDFKNKKITTDDMCALFRNPGEQHTMRTTTLRGSTSIGTFM